MCNARQRPACVNDMDKSACKPGGGAEKAVVWEVFNPGRLKEAAARDMGFLGETVAVHGIAVHAAGNVFYVVNKAGGTPIYGLIRDGIKCHMDEKLAGRVNAGPRLSDLIRPGDKVTVTGVVESIPGIWGAVQIRAEDVTVPARQPE